MKDLVKWKKVVVQTEYDLPGHHTDNLFINGEFAHFMIQNKGDAGFHTYLYVDNRDFKNLTTFKIPYGPHKTLKEAKANLVPWIKAMFKGYSVKVSLIDANADIRTDRYKWITL